VRQFSEINLAFPSMILRTPSAIFFVSFSLDKNLSILKSHFNLLLYKLSGDGIFID